MFLARLIRITLITAIFIAAYLPITINPKIFERIEGSSVSYIRVYNIAAAIDYWPKEV